MNKNNKMISTADMRFATLALIVTLFSGTGAQAQITVNRTYNVNQDVQDRGQLVNSQTISNAGIATINDVNVGLDMGSASGSTMRLGQMYATVTVGTGGGARTAVLLNREGVSSSNAFGSSRSSLNVTFDDAAATNIYNLTGSTGTYAADGRIGVNPFGTRVAYNANQITAGLSALNGSWDNTWSLLVADTQKGNVAHVNSWSLSITGTAASTGTMDVGAGGTISAGGSGTETIGATVSSSGKGASAVSIAASNGKVLDLTGGISGTGDFKTTGDGVVKIGNSANFTGTLEALGGTVVVDGTMNTASKVVVRSGATVGGTGTVGALEVASGGTIGPGHSPGQLNVAGNATWAGGASYEWEVNNFLGSAGTNWDFLNIAGTLNITATSSSKFLIDVVSLLANNNPGNAQNFFPTYDYSLAIATAAGGIQGSLDSLQLDTSAFTNSTTFASWANQPTFTPGHFSLGFSQDNKSIMLNYARAIPEPSSAVLTLVGLGWMAIRRRRGR